MGAVRPVVLVYQDFATVNIPVSLPSLNCLLAGPCYQIEDFSATTEASLLTVTIGSQTTTPTGSASAGTTVSATAIPAVDAGAIVDNSSVLVTSDGGLAELAFGSTGTVAANANTLTDSSAHFVTVAGVLPGDRVVIEIATSGPTVVAKTVLSATDTVLTLTSNITLAGTDINGVSYSGITLVGAASAPYRVERPISATLLASASGVVGASNQVHTTSAAKVLVNNVAKVLTYSPLYTGYRALRYDLAQVNVVQTENDITALLGPIDERNPLAVGAFIASQNANKQLQVFGVQGDNLNSGTDILIAHTACSNIVSSRKDVYAVVPLTTDLPTIEMWSTNATALAAPTIAKFRVIVGNGVIPLTAQISPPTGTSSATAESGIDSSHKNLLDNTATFITSGVEIGDNVVISSVSYPVTAILSENRVSVLDAAMVLTPSSMYTYSIIRTMTPDQQVTALNAVTASLTSSRLVMVLPDQVLVAGVVNTLTGVASEQPGYYLSAAVGGMIAGLPPQQGFTFIGLAGIQQVFGTTGHFSDTELDSLGNGGWYCIVQDNPEAIPYCLHELTTDTTTLESGELMVVKNFDYVSIAYKNALQGFLGVYNVIPSTLDFLASAFDSVTTTLQLQVYPRIGAPILSATLTSIAPLAGEADRVEMYGSVNIPRPLNAIGLHLTA